MTVKKKKKKQVDVVAGNEEVITDDKEDDPALGKDKNEVPVVVNRTSLATWKQNHYQKTFVNLEEKL